MKVCKVYTTSRRFNVFFAQTQKKILVHLEQAKEQLIPLIIVESKAKKIITKLFVAFTGTPPLIKNIKIKTIVADPDPWVNVVMKPTYLTFRPITSDNTT